MKVTPLSERAKAIKHAVLAAIQDAEELGGVADDADYLQLMAELKSEVESRIKACSANLPQPGHTPSSLVPRP